MYDGFVFLGQNHSDKSPGFFPTQTSSTHNLMKSDKSNKILSTIFTIFVCMLLVCNMLTLYLWISKSMTEGYGWEFWQIHPSDVPAFASWAGLIVHLTGFLGLVGLMLYLLLKWIFWVFGKSNFWHSDINKPFMLSIILCTFTVPGIALLDAYSRSITVGVKPTKVTPASQSVTTEVNNLKDKLKVLEEKLAKVESAHDESKWQNQLLSSNLEGAQSQIANMRKESANLQRRLADYEAKDKQSRSLFKMLEGGVLIDGAGVAKLQLLQDPRTGVRSIMLLPADGSTRTVKVSIE